MAESVRGKRRGPGRRRLQTRSLACAGQSQHTKKEQDQENQAEGSEQQDVLVDTSEGYNA